MSQTLTLYGNPISPFAAKVQFFLEESGHPYKYQSVDLMKGEQQTEQFRRMNPFTAVPTIELGGHSMGESNAILRYLAQRYEMDAFYPANLEERANVDQVMEYTSLHVGRFLYTLAWNLHFAPKFGRPTVQAFVDDAQFQLTRHLPRLESYLLGRQFLAGSGITIADAALLPFVANHKLAQISFGDFPNIQAWYSRMADRPAWKKTQTEIEKLLT